LPNQGERKREVYPKEAETGKGDELWWKIQPVTTGVSKKINWKAVDMNRTRRRKKSKKREGSHPEGKKRTKRMDNPEKQARRTIKLT